MQIIVLFLQRVFQWMLTWNSLSLVERAKNIAVIRGRERPLSFQFSELILARHRL